MKYSHTERGRLSHKLRDGAYRARRQGCYVDPNLTLKIAMPTLLKMRRCFYCNKPLILTGTFGYTLEHKKALILGGSHTLDNITLACPECNQEKWTKDDAEFGRQLITRWMSQ